jgi:hypothetical protein
MGVVAHIGGDKNKTGQCACIDVLLKLLQGDHFRSASPLVQPDRIEVHKRVMLLLVFASRLALKFTRGLHVLLVGLPGATAGFDQVGQTWRIDKAILAVAIDIKGIPADHGQVIWQAGMGDCMVPGKQCVIGRIPVVDRHEQVADHFMKVLVLEGNDHNMIEVRQGGGCYRNGFGCM